MIFSSLTEEDERATALIPLRKCDLQAWTLSQSDEIREWVGSSSFTAEAHQTLRIPGRPMVILVGLGDEEDRWSYGGLPSALPKGVYRIGVPLDTKRATRAAVGWVTGNYCFSEYRARKEPVRKLCWPTDADREAVFLGANAICFVRDLINRPANDLGPAELAAIAQDIAEEFGAKCSVLADEETLRENYPLVYAVGQASARKPRLVDMRWGDPSAPKLTIVGKGVCFDTGGLNIKDRGPMLLMKLDMGGAAHSLALARMVMQSKLPVRLRVLIPVVENAIGGNAIRPRDVIRSRKGLTVEIGDTDAEGRLILADALYEASTENPDLLIDMATLTGSARVALGTDITALFTDNDDIAERLLQASRVTEDPIWRLPLWKPYAKDLKGKIADLTNVADLNLGPTTFAGATYAALFLARFIEPVKNWIHLDLCGWNPGARPGRPEGGEAFSLLAVFSFLTSRYRP